jgi:hypothetical protein
VTNAGADKWELIGPRTSPWLVDGLMEDEACLLVVSIIVAKHPPQEEFTTSKKGDPYSELAREG